MLAFCFVQYQEISDGFFVYWNKVYEVQLPDLESDTEHLSSGKILKRHSLDGISDCSTGLLLFISFLAD